MSAAGAIVERARRELLAGVSEQLNRLGATIDNDDTTLSFAFELRGLKQGSIIEIELEQMYVWDLPSASTALVERGFNGTTAVAHTAPVLVTVAPRFSRFDLLNYVNADLADLSSPANGLFNMRSIDVPYTGDGRDVPVDFGAFPPIASPYAVRARWSTREWTLLRKWELVRDQLTSDFPTGFALRLFDEPWISGNLRVQYKAPYGTVASLTDELTSITIGYTSPDDLLVMGVQLHAMSRREVKRNFSETQPEPRRAGEVPPGAIGNSSQPLARLRQQRIVAEAARLNARYPLMVYR